MTLAHILHTLVAASPTLAAIFLPVIALPIAWLFFAVAVGAPGGCSQNPDNWDVLCPAFHEIALMIGFMLGGVSTVIRGVALGLEAVSPVRWQRLAQITMAAVVGFGLGVVIFERTNDNYAVLISAAGSLFALSIVFATWRRPGDPQRLIAVFVTSIMGAAWVGMFQALMR